MPFVFTQSQGLKRRWVDSPVLHCRNLIIDLALACRSISSDDWTNHLSSAVVGKQASSFIWVLSFAVQSNQGLLKGLKNRILNWRKVIVLSTVKCYAFDLQQHALGLIDIAPKGRHTRVHSTRAEIYQSRQTQCTQIVKCTCKMNKTHYRSRSVGQLCTRSMLIIFNTHCSATHFCLLLLYCRFVIE